GTLQNPRRVTSGHPIILGNSASVAHQAASQNKFTKFVDRRNRMARRERDELFTPAQEIRVVGNKQCPCPWLDHALERCVNVSFPAGSEEKNLLSNQPCRFLHVSDSGFGTRVRWIH